MAYYIWTLLSAYEVPVPKCIILCIWILFLFRARAFLPFWFFLCQQDNNNDDEDDDDDEVPCCL